MHSGTKKGGVNMAKKKSFKMPVLKPITDPEKLKPGIVETVDKKNSGVFVSVVIKKPIKP